MTPRYSLVWAFALFLCAPCRADAPAFLADCREALARLSPVASGLRAGAYPRESHEAADSALKTLSGRLAERAPASAPLRALQIRVAEAQAAEGPFWAGLSQESASASRRIPPQRAAPLLSRLEAVIAALEEFVASPAADVPRGTDAAAQVHVPSADLRGAAVLADPRRWNAAVDAGRSAVFWDMNTASGDVNGRAGPEDPAAQGGGTDFGRSPAAAPAPKGLMLRAVPSVGLGAQDPRSAACRGVLGGHPRIAELCREHPTLAPLLGGVLDAFKAQFGTVQGLVMNLVFLILGLVLSALSGFGLVAKVAVSLASLGLLAATLGPLVKEGWDASRELLKSAAGTLGHSRALLRLGQVGGTVLVLALMSAVGWGVGKTKPGRAALQSMQGALSGAMSKVGAAQGAAALDARLPASVKASLERVFGPAPAPQKAPAPVSAKGELTGSPAHINSAETPSNKLALQRQNDSARILAENGYKVHQNGLQAGPDYILDGVGHDCYSPTSPNPRNIWDTISGKVRKNQAHSFVINMDGSPVELSVLQEHFVRYPIPTLNDVLVVRDGKVIRLMKAGQAAVLAAK